MFVGVILVRKASVSVALRWASLVRRVTLSKQMYICFDYWPDPHKIIIFL